MAGIIRSKKAQGAETLTWVVATIIIVLLTFVFIYISGEFGRLRFNFQSIEEKDSGKQTQQTLFAILQKKGSGNLELIELLRTGKYNELGNEVQKVLEELEANDIKCSFYAYELTNSNRMQKIGIEKGGEGKMVSLEFENKGAELKC